MKAGRPQMAAQAGVAHMNHAAIRPDAEFDEGDVADLRAAPRYTLLIRAAKLISPQGEFVCVIRDVSSTGVSVRLFHPLPQCDPIALELRSGEIYKIERRWEREGEAGFQFSAPVNVEHLVAEVGQFPKRGLRLGVEFPIAVKTLTLRRDATIKNISQQGARIECDALLAIDQTVRIESKEIPEVRAKIRWRRDRDYGLVFDDTFTLGDFAKLAVRLQCPTLLQG